MTNIDLTGNRCCFECENCSAKLGSPELCGYCNERRNICAKYHKSRQLKDLGDDPKQQMRELAKECHGQDGFDYIVSFGLRDDTIQDKKFQKLRAEYLQTKLRLAEYIGFDGRLWLTDGRKGKPPWI